MDKKVQKLVSYVRELPDFEVVEVGVGKHNHMGATIVEGILQSGINYRNVVKPRVERIKGYPKARTTTGFLKLYNKINLKDLLAWTGDKKPNWIKGVVDLFIEENIENENDLKNWLEKDINVNRFMELDGVGNATLDYFKILVGLSTGIANLHILDFLNQAGINVNINDYDRVKKIINGTADILDIKRELFDHSIWQYMSNRNN